jgi:YVTN family beta-propeller protein
LVSGNFAAINGANPFAIAYDSGKKEVYVANTASNNVDVISAATNAIVATINVGDYPNGVAYDSGKGEIFVVNDYDWDVSVINDTANTVVTTINVGIYPFGVVYDRAKGEIFVANEDSNTVSVINDTNNTAWKSVNVGLTPYGLAYDPAMGEVFVTNSGSNNVSVISDSNNTAWPSIGVGDTPYAAAYDSGTGQVFVTNEIDNNVSVISDTSNTVVATVNVGLYPEGVSYDSALDEVFAANWGTDNVSVISDSSDLVVGTVNVGTFPGGAAYDDVLGETFVANYYSSNVSVIDDSSNTVAASVLLGITPNSIVYDSAKGEFYVANSCSDNVSVINALTNRVVATVSVGVYPDGVVYDSAMGEIFVANAISANVSVINDTSNTVVYTINSGLDTPYALAYDPAKGEIFVTNYNSDYVAVISDQTYSVTDIVVGNSPQGLAYDSATGEVFVANANDDTVSVISDTTNLVVTTVGVGAYPDAIAYDSAKGEVFVGNAYSANVSVMNDVNNKVVKNINVGQYPNGLVYDKVMGEIYVANWNSGNVTVISDATNAVVTNFAAGMGSSIPEYDPSNGYVYVVNYDQGTVSIIPSWPALASVAVVPSTTSIAIGGSASFTATPTCTGGTCLPGTTYKWDITNPAMGTLNASTGSVVKFTALSTTGVVHLFVNATFNGNTAMSPAVTITITLPPLNLVTVSPSSAVIVNGHYQNFTAIPSCGGGPCQPGTTFAWALLHKFGMGTLNITTGSTVKYTATTVGTQELFVNATLNAVKIMGAPVVITILPPLTSVTVSPSPTDVVINTAQSFTAKPVCTGGPCPSGTTFGWSLTNTLGSLNASTSSVVGFTAGSTTGNVVLFVNATVEGITVMSLPVKIAVVSALPPALVSVTVSPSTATVNTRAYKDFTAIPACSGGGACSGVSYTWALAPASLGTLNASTSTVVNFTAGHRAGQGTLYLNATQGSNTAQATVLITVVAGIEMVSVAPASALNMSGGGSQQFNATPICGRTACGPGITYIWSLTNSHIGYLNSTGSTNVTFTAYYIAGNVTMYLNVTMNGITVQARIPISVNASSLPMLSSVAISPTSQTIQVGALAAFTANPTCTGGACPPANITYAWTLTSTIATVSPATGISVNVTAVGPAGSLGLFVNATYNGMTVMSSAAIITITSTPVATLQSVSVSPKSANLAFGGTQTFNATPTCSAQCPTSGISYSWSITNSAMGTLTGAGAIVTFTAKSIAGTVALFVNATLNDNTVKSSPVVVSISSTVVPVLSSVAVKPASSSLAVGGTATFNATAVCTGGTGICPSGASFSWTLTNTLGKLSTSTGSSVIFTATATGTDNLFVNCTLNDKTVRSAPVVITIGPSSVPTLSSVSVSPGSETLKAGGTVEFTATPTCTGGTCPAGTTYAWSLTSSSLGTISSPTGSVVNFTAGQTAGTVTLFVNATLNGKSAMTQVTITVTTSSTTSNILGLSTSAWYIIIAVIVVVVALILVVLIWRRSSGGGKDESWWKSTSEEGGATSGAEKEDGDEKETSSKDDESTKDDNTTSSESKEPTGKDSPKDD